MNNKKMVFFVPNLTPRPNRRIQEFIDAGFDCEVYCMSHSEDIVTPRYKVTYLNENKLSKMSYPRRMLLFFRQIGSVVDRFDKKKTLFYFFSFNTAFLVLLRRNLQFIYEESDMLFDRFSSSFLQNLIIKLNRKIISKSGVTVFTSEGFAHFYYNRNIPKNIVFVPNKVDKRVLELPVVNKHEANFSHLKFGFVGSLRYETLRNFAYVLIKNFPSAQFDFYGRNSDFSDEQIEKLKSTGRIFFHGTFTNPDDLKLYEAIFFRTPIIVSRDSFLEHKVKELGVGFSVNALDDNDIVSQVNNINPEDYKGFVSKLSSIEKESVITSNEELIQRVLSL